MKSESGFSLAIASQPFETGEDPMALPSLFLVLLLSILFVSDHLLHADVTRKGGPAKKEELLQQIMSNKKEPLSYRARKSVRRVIRWGLPILEMLMLRLVDWIVKFGQTQDLSGMRMPFLRQDLKGEIFCILPQ